MMTLIMMTMVVMMKWGHAVVGLRIYPPISLSTTRSKMSTYITYCSLSGEEHPPQREHHNGRHLQRSARHQTKVSRSELFRYLNGDQVTIEMHWWSLLYNALVLWTCRQRVVGVWFCRHCEGGPWHCTVGWLHRRWGRSSWSHRADSGGDDDCPWADLCSA